MPLIVLILYIFAINLFALLLRLPASGLTYELIYNLKIFKNVKD